MENSQVLKGQLKSVGFDRSAIVLQVVIEDNTGLVADAEFTIGGLLAGSYVLKYGNRNTRARVEKDLVAQAPMSMADSISISLDR